MSLHRVFVSLCLVMLLLTGIAAAGVTTKAPEIRALWVTRNILTSPESIANLVDRAKRTGFNTLIAQVRGRGDALYRSQWEPRSTLLKDQPESFDPLALLIEKAHAARLTVHAWLNTCLLANLDDLPASPQHAYNAHPDWLMVPRQVAQALYSMEPESPDYRARIVEQSKKDLSELEGLYLSPAHPGVKEHLYNIWMDVLEKYEVDGLHFDYVRYPNPDFDYSRVALDRFRDWLRGQITAEEQRLIAMVAANDPVVFTTVFPEKWAAFRKAQVTEIVERIFQGVKARKPNVLVTAAVFADDVTAEERRFQEWKLWLERGLLDVACPMAYTTDTETFKKQIAIARGFSFGRQIWAGIGAYRMPVAGTLEKINMARKIGTDGFVLFSYDNVMNPSGINPTGDYLERVQKATVGR